MFALLGNEATACSMQHVKWSDTCNIAPITNLYEHGLRLQPSVLDLLAAPTVFLQEALVYRHDLDSGALQSALQAVINQQPLFAARLTGVQDGQLALLLQSKSAGVTFMQGVAAELSLQHIHTPNQQEQQVQCPDLPDALFRHLPGSLLPQHKDNPNLALTHVALVRLDGGGCILGFRVSHLLGDWSSLQLLMQSTATEYSKIAAQQNKHQIVDVDLPAALPLAAPLLNKLVSEARKQLPPGFIPVRFKLLEPEDEQKFSKLASLSSDNGSSRSDADGGSSDGPGSSSSNSRNRAPKRLTYHVAPKRIQQLKAQALVAAAAAGTAAESTAADMAWCSTHNIALARLLQAFMKLPGRQHLLHDVSVAVDMRRRIPQRYMQHLPYKQQQLLQYSVGNFFASAIYEGCRGAEGLAAWQLAQQLFKAVQSVQDIWLPDLAWTCQVMGLSDSELQKDAMPQIPAGFTHSQVESKDQQAQEQQQLVMDSKQQKLQVTWRRLHAMGPHHLLPQQMELGLLPSLSTTQWPLNFAVDTSMAGHLPVYAVPAFSQPQPYPLVLMQQAPDAAGGGIMVHVFLDEVEAARMDQALQVQGGI